MREVVYAASRHRVETGGLLYSLQAPTWRGVHACYAARVR